MNLKLKGLVKLVDFVENKNFNDDLNVAYLSLLKDYSYTEEFEERLPESVHYIKSVVESSKDIVKLKMVDDILEYKKSL